MSEDAAAPITNGADFMRAIGVTSLHVTFPGSTMALDVELVDGKPEVEVSDWRSRLRKQAKP